MKRTILTCLAATLILPTLATTPALARKSGTTRDRCGEAVAREARNRFGRGDFALLSNDIREVGDENRMSGTARLDRRSFHYQCTYNVRSERTYGVSLRQQGGGNGGSWGGGHGGGNGSGWGNGARLPRGSWARSCRGADMRGSMLTAECRNARGKWRDAQINVRSCLTGGLGNQNGQLVCE